MRIVTFTLFICSIHMGSNCNQSAPGKSPLSSSASAKYWSFLGKGSQPEGQPTLPSTNNLLVSSSSSASLSKEGAAAVVVLAVGTVAFFEFCKWIKSYFFGSETDTIRIELEKLVAELAIIKGESVALRIADIEQAIKNRNLDSQTKSLLLKKLKEFEEESKKLPCKKS